MNSISHEGIRQGLALLSVMQGEYVWGVTLSIDNVLFMEFGIPYLQVRERRPSTPDGTRDMNDLPASRMVLPTGWRHLFIEDAEWVVTTRHHSCARTDTDHTHIKRALLALDGQKLMTINFMPNSATWQFDFDLGGTLTIGPSSDAETPDWAETSQWALFAEDDDTYFYTNAGELKHE